MVGKLLGGGLVLLGTALLCRAETRTRRQQTERLADTRRRDRRQQERLLWTAALSGAGLFIILLM